MESKSSSSSTLGQVELNFNLSTQITKQTTLTKNKANSKNENKSNSNHRNTTKHIYKLAKNMNKLITEIKKIIYISG